MGSEPHSVVAEVVRRGVSIAGDALLTLGATRLELVVRRDGCDPAQLEVRYDDVRELVREGDRILELALQRGDRVRLGFGDASAADAVESLLLRRCCELPELTRALRSLGRRRAVRASAAEADRFFQPLLEARREAADGGMPAAVAAFRGSALAARLEGVAAEFAAARHPERPSARRALEARLCDRLDPVLAALHDLDAAAEPLTDAAGSSIGAWRVWTARLRVVFERADECWPHLAAELAAPMAERVSRSDQPR